MSHHDPVCHGIPLIGREHDHETVVALLARPDSRLVTITGVGGVGKTALAHLVADGVESSGQRVVFVDLAPLTAGAWVPLALASALDLPHHADRDPVQCIGEHLDAFPTMLVLDNLEHLDAAPVLANLLAATTQTCILATSRKRLGIAGESVYPLTPLPVPEWVPAPGAASAIASLLDNASVQLLMQRFAQAGASLTITPTNAGAIANLARWLDGIPLAIELAARHGRLFAVGDILGQLHAQRDVLRGGDREGRLRAMEDSVRWSLDLLDPATRMGFRQLCVIRGAFDVETALALTSLELDAFATLVDHGLVDALPWTDQRSSRMFRVLIPIREQGERDARQAGVWAAMQDRHAKHFLALAEQADYRRLGTDAAAANAVLERHSEDVLTAFDWALERGDVIAAARAAGAPSAYWQQHAPIRIGLALLDRIAEALDTAPECPMPVRTRLALMRGTLLHHIGDLDAAGIVLDRAIAQARHLNPPQPALLADTILQRIDTFRAMRMVDDAERLVAEAQAAVDRAGLPVLATKLHFECAAIAYHRRRWDDVERHVFASMAARRQLDPQLRNVGLPGLLGLAHLGRGNIDAARACFHWVIDASTVAEPSRYATKEYLARLELRVNRPKEAAGILADCLRVQHRRGSAIWIAAVLIDCAWLATLVGEDARAVTLLAAAGAGDERAIDLLVKDEVTQMMEALAARTGNAAFHAALSLGYLGDRRVLIDETLAWLEALPSRLPDPAPRPVPPVGLRLSRREREVLASIAGGASNKRIAERLFISVTTVDTHVKTIYRKLGVTSRAAAVSEGVRLRLLDIGRTEHEA